MKINLRNKEHLEIAITEMKKHKYLKKPYKSFYPLKRIKGTIKKVHRLGRATSPQEEISLYKLENSWMARHFHSTTLTSIVFE